MPTPMVVIRLSRAGSVHRPFYHVVVTDSRARRDSSHIERIGYLNYYASGGELPLKLDVDRVEHWVSKGAVVRPSVKKLIRRVRRGDVAPRDAAQPPVEEVVPPKAAEAETKAEPEAAAEDAPAAAAEAPEAAEAAEAKEPEATEAAAEPEEPAAEAAGQEEPEADVSGEPAGEEDKAAAQ